MFKCEPKLIDHIRKGDPVNHKFMQRVVTLLERLEHIDSYNGKVMTKEAN